MATQKMDAKTLAHYYDEEAVKNIELRIDNLRTTSLVDESNKLLRDSIRVEDDCISDEKIFIEEMRDLMKQRKRIVKKARITDYRVRNRHHDSEKTTAKAFHDRDKYVKQFFNLGLQIDYMATLRNKYFNTGTLVFNEILGTYLRDNDPVFEELNKLGEINSEQCSEFILSVDKNNSSQEKLTNTILFQHKNSPLQDTLERSNKNSIQTPNQREKEISGDNQHTASNSNSVEKERPVAEKIQSIVNISTSTNKMATPKMNSTRVANYYDEDAVRNIERRVEDLKRSDLEEECIKILRDSINIEDVRITDEKIFLDKIVDLVKRRRRIVKKARITDYRVRNRHQDSVKTTAKAFRDRDKYVRQFFKLGIQMDHMSSLRNKYFDTGALVFFEHIGVYLRDNDPVFTELKKLGEIKSEECSEFGLIQHKNGLLQDTSEGSKIHSTMQMDNPRETQNGCNKDTVSNPTEKERPVVALQTPSDEDTSSFTTPKRTGLAEVDSELIFQFGLSHRNTSSMKDKISDGSDSRSKRTPTDRENKQKTIFGSDSHMTGWSDGTQDIKKYYPESFDKDSYDRLLTVGAHSERDSTIHSECVAMVRHLREISLIQGQLNYVQRQLELEERNSTKLLIQNQAYESEVFKLKQELENTQKAKDMELRNLRDNLKLTENENASLKTEIEVQNGKLLQAWAEEMKSLSLTESDTRSKIDALTAENKTLQGRNESLERKYKTQSFELQMTKQNVDQLEKAMKALQTYNTELSNVKLRDGDILRDELTEAKSQIQQHLTRLNEVETSRNQMIRDYEKKCVQLKSELELARNYSPNSARTDENNDDNVSDITSTSTDSTTARKGRRRRRKGKRSKQKPNKESTDKSSPTSSAKSRQVSKSGHGEEKSPKTHNEQMPIQQQALQQQPLQVPNTLLNQQMAYTMPTAYGLNQGYQLPYQPQSSEANRFSPLMNPNTHYNVIQPIGANLYENKDAGTLGTAFGERTELNTINYVSDNASGSRAEARHGRNVSSRAPFNNEKKKNGRDINQDTKPENDETTQDQIEIQTQLMRNDPNYDFSKLAKQLVFNGENWPAFIKTFEMLQCKANWNDETAAWMFRFTLRGRALDVWGQLDDAIQKSYNLLKAQYQKFFGVSDNPSILRQKLANLKQEDHDSIDDYYLKILLLIKNAYPSCSQKTLDEIGYDIFLMGLKDDSISALVRSTITTKNLPAAYESAREHFIFKDSKICHKTNPYSSPGATNIHKAEVDKEKQVSKYERNREYNEKSHDRDRRDDSRDRNYRRDNPSDGNWRNRDVRQQNSYREQRSRNFNGNSSSSSCNNGRRGYRNNNRRRGRCYDCGSTDHYKGSRYCREYDRYYSGSPNMDDTYDSSRYSRMHHQRDRRNDDRDWRSNYSYDSGYDYPRNNYNRSRYDQERDLDTRGDYLRDRQRPNYINNGPESPNWRHRVSGVIPETPRD